MIYAICLGLLAGHVAANDITASSTVESLDAETQARAERGRMLFPIYAVGSKCARFCSARDRSAAPVMKDSADVNLKGPVVHKALEMLALNDDLNTVVESPSRCTRRNA